MQSNEFNRAAYFKNKNGTLFFGGVGGLTWFDPHEVEIQPDDSKVKITGFKLNNKNADSLLVNNTCIELPYNQSLITFEFAKLNLSTINRTQYVYKLEKNSNSEEWIDLRGQSSITLTELSPADYKMYISAYDYHGKVEPQHAILAFSIAEPWWCNDWLKVLAFLIFSAIAYYLYFVKVKTRLKLENLKNNISRDLHDEIGSTLSSIALYGTIAERELVSKPEKVKKLVQKINSYALSSIASINDIVWSIKPGNETLGELIKRVRFYLSEIDETENWQTSVEHDDRISNFSLSSDQKRNLFLIIKESINNALKHSEGSTINVHFLYNHKNQIITIEIEDNGIGIHNDVEEGNGIANMYNRAGELNGSLKLLSEENKGLKVIVTFNKDRKKI